MPFAVFELWWEAFTLRANAIYTRVRVNYNNNNKNNNTNKNNELLIPFRRAISS